MTENGSRPSELTNERDITCTKRDHWSINPNQKFITKAEISKLHFQIWYARKTAIAKYIEKTGLWDKESDRIIVEVWRTCGCVFASSRRPHSKVAVWPLRTKLQSQMSIDVIKQEERSYLHISEELTVWSEAAWINGSRWTIKKKSYIDFTF